MTYDFAQAQAEWVKVPIDGVGYVSTEEMLRWDDARLRATVEQLERTRYDVNGWRNHGDGWRRGMGLDSTHGKRVIDYGCGIGVEALQYAKSGNDVIVADIVPSNVELAQRVLSLWGHRAHGIVLSAEPPYFDWAEATLDVFNSNGVMHHFPYAREVLLRATRAMRSGGEVRLLLYSDNLWLRTVGGLLPPVEQPIETHPAFGAYYSAHDAVGKYADWYNREKLEQRFGDFLEVASVDYITSDQAFIVTTMRPKKP